MLTEKLTTRRVIKYEIIPATLQPYKHTHKHTHWSRFNKELEFPNYFFRRGNYYELLREVAKLQPLISL